MSGLVFGQVDAKVSNPWGYDSTNDLPKSHPLYLVSAGLVSTLLINNSPVTAGTLVTTSQGAISVPNGKNGYVLDFSISASGIFLAELDINTTGQYTLNTPAAGGSDFMRLRSPIKVPGGDTVGVIWKNNDSSTKDISVYLAVAIL